MTVRVAGAVILLVLGSVDVGAQTRIVRVSDVKPTLTAGGNAVRVAVEGTDLGEVTSARLLLNGRVVTGLSGVVTRGSRLGNALMVDITAAQSVAPGSYQLELVSATGRVQVPLDVTVRSAAQMRAALAEVTRVARVTPASVTLQPGGGAQTVTLHGTMLTQLRAARVERSGAAVSGVQAELLPSTNAERRQVRLSVRAIDTPPLDVPLDLVLEAELLPGDATTSRGGRQLAAAAAAKAAAKPVLIRTSVKVTVTEPRVEVSAGELFAAPIEGVFANARSSFASCGGTAADRRFSVEVPGAGYAAAGDVARLENTASVAERIAYLEAHSLTPTDAFRPDQLVNLLTRGHPSPFPHSLSAIRMCLRPMRATGPWKVTDVELVNGEPQVVIRVTYPVAHFLGRGMPAAPGGVPDGLHIGIRWGHGVTDAEVPDLVYAQPEFEVRLPVAVESGRITYGAPQVTRRGPARQWSGTFQGPGSARRRLESYANARMQQVAREIGKAFGATRTKNAISSAIMSRLQSRGVTQVSALRRLSPDTWAVVLP